MEPADRLEEVEPCAMEGASVAVPGTGPSGVLVRLFVNEAFRDFCSLPASAVVISGIGHGFRHTPKPGCRRLQPQQILWNSKRRSGSFQLDYAT